MDNTTANGAELDVSITTTMTEDEHCNPVSTELPANVLDSAKNTPQLYWVSVQAISPILRAVQAKKRRSSNTMEATVLTGSPYKRMIEDKAKAMKHTKQLKKYRIRATKVSKNATKKNTIRQQNDDSKVTMCLVCGETYQEAWIQCARCKLWAHEDCADITDSLYYFSDNCKDVSLQNKRRKAVRCQTITKPKR